MFALKRPIASESDFWVDGQVKPASSRPQFDELGAPQPTVGLYLRMPGKENAVLKADDRQRV